MAFTRNIGSTGTGLGGQQSSLPSEMGAKYFAFGESQFIYAQFTRAEVMSINLDGNFPELIGQISFRFLDNAGKSETTLPLALPINSSIKLYPVRGEVVYVVDFAGKFYYVSAINTSNFVNNNSTTGITATDVNTPKSHLTNYKSVTDTGIANVETTNPQPIVGVTFRDAKSKIGILRPKEGDYILTGRFGNNIRLGNNPKTNSPNIKIGLIDPNTDTYSVLEEDLDLDNSIWLTTDESLNFKASGIKINPKNNAPNQYTGNQIAIFSDRLIFNSKKEDTILMSNKGILLTCNQNFSVDSNASILLTSKDDTVLSAKKILLGSDSAKEALVLGNTLIDILGELLDQMAVEIHPTPSGPSSPPTNAAQYKAIKLKLKQALSKSNYTV